MRSRREAAVACGKRHYDLTKMAASVSRFVSASRKVGSYLMNSLVLGQAAVCGHKMDSENQTKV